MGTQASKFLRDLGTKVDSGKQSVAWSQGSLGVIVPTFAKMVLEISLKSTELVGGGSSSKSSEN